jgi:hypothetical protein
MRVGAVIFRLSCMILRSLSAKPATVEAGFRAGCTGLTEAFARGPFVGAFDEKHERTTARNCPIKPPAGRARLIRVGLDQATETEAGPSGSCGQLNALGYRPCRQRSQARYWRAMVQHSVPARGFAVILTTS